MTEIYVLEVLGAGSLRQGGQHVWVLVWKCFSAAMAGFSLCPSVVEIRAEGSEVSRTLVRTLIPFTRASPMTSSHPNYGACWSRGMVLARIGLIKSSPEDMNLAM